MLITENDVGRFAVAADGSILKVGFFDSDDPVFPVMVHFSYRKTDGKSPEQDPSQDLICWADEHPVYKAVFMWGNSQ